MYYGPGSEITSIEISEDLSATYQTENGSYTVESYDQENNCLPKELPFIQMERNDVNYQSK
jgi:hypothetical protein